MDHSPVDILAESMRWSDDVNDWVYAWHLQKVRHLDCIITDDPRRFEKLNDDVGVVYEERADGVFAKKHTDVKKHTTKKNEAKATKKSASSEQLPRTKKEKSAISALRPEAKAKEKSASSEQLPRTTKEKSAISELRPRVSASASSGSHVVSASASSSSSGPVRGECM